MTVPEGIGLPALTAWRPALLMYCLATAFLPSLLTVLYRLKPVGKPAGKVMCDLRIAAISGVTGGVAAAGLAVPVGGEVVDVGLVETRGDAVHDDVLAIAGLEGFELLGDVRGALAGEMRGVVVGGVGDVARRAGQGLGLAGGRIASGESNTGDTERECENTDDAESLSAHP